MPKNDGEVKVGFLADKKLALMIRKQADREDLSISQYLRVLVRNDLGIGPNKRFARPKMSS